MDQGDPQIDDRSLIRDDKCMRVVDVRGVATVLGRGTILRLMGRHSTAVLTANLNRK